MRPLSALLVICAFATQASADSPTAPSHKPSWEWSLEERIASRLDPVAVQARMQAHTARESRRGRARVVSTSAVVEAATFVIDGSVNPELFMSWELMERLLIVTEPGREHTAAVRGTFSAAVMESGWDEASFWRSLDEISKDYYAVRAEIRANDAPEHDKARLERATAVHRYLGSRFCSVRHETLVRARAVFGAGPFERFLYTAIAPNVVVFAETPMTAAQLRNIAGGCQ